MPLQSFPSKEGDCVIQVPSGAPPPRAAKAWGDSTAGESPHGFQGPAGDNPNRLVSAKLQARRKKERLGAVCPSVVY